MPTPHNNAKMGDIAKTVLMPGDPLRAKYIAETYLQDVTCFNTVRNMLGYTGYYRGKKVSVMGSGMGMPSIGIYSYELYKFYDVENIIRIGSAGSYVKELKIFDVLLVSDAYSESTFAKVFNNVDGDIAQPSPVLNDLIEDTAKSLNIPLTRGRIHSSDVFYHEANSQYIKEVQDKNCFAVEMESYALFSNAQALNKKAACILTISDSFVSKEETTAEQRQTSFNTMMKLALETAIKL